MWGRRGTRDPQRADRVVLEHPPGGQDPLRRLGPLLHDRRADRRRRLRQLEPDGRHAGGARARQSRSVRQQRQAGEWYSCHRYLGAGNPLGHLRPQPDRTAAVHRGLLRRRAPITSPSSSIVVNGQDDDGDGWVDEGFDGIDNDGDGVIDPGFNGHRRRQRRHHRRAGRIALSSNWPAATTGGEYEPETVRGERVQLAEHQRQPDGQGLHDPAPPRGDGGRPRGDAARGRGDRPDDLERPLGQAPGDAARAVAGADRPVLVLRRRDDRPRRPGSDGLSRAVGRGGLQRQHEQFPDVEHAILSLLDLRA